MLTRSENPKPNNDETPRPHNKQEGSGPEIHTLVNNEIKLETAYAQGYTAYKIIKKLYACLWLCPY